MKVHIYKDKVGDWRANITASNGRIIFATSEGYKNRSDLYDNLRLIQQSLNQFLYESII